MKKDEIKKIFLKIAPYTFINSIGIGILKLITGALNRSAALIISAFYNFFVGITKINAIKSDSKSLYKEYSKIGIMLVITSIVYIFYSVLVMEYDIKSDYKSYIAILITAVTLFDIGFAATGVIKAKMRKNIKTEMLKYINLSTAVISLSLTQKAILSFTEKGSEMSNLNGTFGIFVGGIVVIIGIYMFIKGNLNAKKYDQ